MKRLMKNIFISVGSTRVLKMLNQTPRVIFWHGIDHISNCIVEAESLEVEVFQSQIDFLIENFEIISINEFYNRFQNESFTNKEVVLTFDDGYLNNLSIVAPYLNDKKIPFTVFISTEHIETGEIFPTSIARLVILGSNLKTISIPELNFYNLNITGDKDKNIVYNKVSHALKNEPLTKVRKIIENLKSNFSENEYFELIDKYDSVKPMNWEEVKKLHQLGATIGSHCEHHICCHENQDIKEVKRQISRSKIILEEKLNSECEFFAYPNGDFTEESNQLVINAGYKMGFSVQKKRVSIQNHLATIPRICVPRDLASFKISMAIYPKK